jgi:hypothetical protein
VQVSRHNNVTVTHHHIVVLLHVRVVRPAAASSVVVQLMVRHQATHARRKLLNISLQHSMPQRIAEK